MFLFRKIVSYPSFYLMNLVGMAAAMSIVILAANIARWETSYDAHWSKADRLQILHSNAPGRFGWQTGFRLPIVGLFRETVPGVDTAAITRNYPVELKVTDRELTLNAFEVEPSIVDIFDFDLIEGSLVDTLNTKISVGISLKTARRLFDTESALGQAIDIDGSQYTVGAVFKTQGANKKYLFDVLFGINVTDLNFAEWNSGLYELYFIHSDGFEAAQLTSAIDAFSDNVNELFYANKDPRFPRTKRLFGTFSSSTLNQLYYDGVGLDKAEITPAQRVTYLTALTSIVLILAVLNMVGLFTAKSVRDGKGVAIRKVLGASTRNIFANSMVETLSVSIIAMICATALSEFVAPSVADLLKTDFVITYYDPRVWGIILAAVLVGGFGGGLYPGLVLSNVAPGDVLGAPSSKSWLPNPLRLQKALVGIQIVLAAVFVFGAVGLIAQINHAQTKDLGFNPNKLAYVKGADIAFKNSVDNYTGILAASWTNNRATDTLSRSGKPVRAKKRQEIFAQQTIGKDFFKVAGIKPLAGQGVRELAETNQIRYQKSETKIRPIILNKAAVDMFELGTPEEAIGQELRISRPAYKVIGVIDNIRYSSVMNSVEPTLYYATSKKYLGYLAIRYSGSDQQFVENMQRLWGQHFPDKPLELDFADDLISTSLARETRLATILMMCSLIAILISCIGAYALTQFHVARQRREIGLRKSFGATTAQVFKLLWWRQLKISLLALLIAAPIAWMLVGEFLQRFVNRISSQELGLLFCAAAFVIMLPGALTILGQTRRASRQSPAHIFRDL